MTKQVSYLTFERGYLRWRFQDHRTCNVRVFLARKRRWSKLDTITNRTATAALSASINGYVNA
jgi:hypothetical protein